MWNPTPPGGGATPPTPTSNSTQPIRALLPGILRRAEQQHKTLRTIQRGWGGLVGKRLAAHARPVGVQRGRLIVAVDCPGDGFLLSYQRAKVLERLQAETDGAIHDIVIRPSDGVPH